MKIRILALAVVAIAIVSHVALAGTATKNSQLIEKYLKDAYGTEPFVTSWYKVIGEISIDNNGVATVSTSLYKDMTPKRTRTALCVAFKFAAIANKDLEGKGVKRVLVKDKAGTLLAVADKGDCWP